MLADLRRPERTFTIRQLCNEFKATPRALRFYEDKGLLTPAREGLNRVYSAQGPRPPAADPARQARGPVAVGNPRTARPL